MNDHKICLQWHKTSFKHIPASAICMLIKKLTGANQFCNNAGAMKTFNSSHLFSCHQLLLSPVAIAHAIYYSLELVVHYFADMALYQVVTH